MRGDDQKVAHNLAEYWATEHLRASLKRRFGSAYLALEDQLRLKTDQLRAAEGQIEKLKMELFIERSPGRVIQSWELPDEIKALPGA